MNFQKFSSSAGFCTVTTARARHMKLHENLATLKFSPGSGLAGLAMAMRNCHITFMMLVAHSKCIAR